MQKNRSGSLDHLEKAFLKIRAGKHRQQWFQQLWLTLWQFPPLSQVANVSTPDAKTITVQPWEKI